MVKMVFYIMCILPPKNICTQMFMVSLFTGAKRWLPAPKCPSTDG